MKWFAKDAGFLPEMPLGQKLFMYVGICMLAVLATSLLISSPSDFEKTVSSAKRVINAVCQPEEPGRSKNDMQEDLNAAVSGGYGTIYITCKE